MKYIIVAVVYKLINWVFLDFTFFTWISLFLLIIFLLFRLTKTFCWLILLFNFRLLIFNCNWFLIWILLLLLLVIILLFICWFLTFTHLLIWTDNLIIYFLTVGFLFFIFMLILFLILILLNEGILNIKISLDWRYLFKIFIIIHYNFKLISLWVSYNTTFGSRLLIAFKIVHWISWRQHFLLLICFLCIDPSLFSILIILSIIHLWYNKLFWFL